MPLKKYPDFSVLMSVYKREKPEYLDEALSSIENQTIIPTEIILVEDGPIPIELKKVIIKHKKKWGNSFKDIVLEKNQGLAAALRLGTEYVSTNWIARMDSDDISVPNRFEFQLKEILKNPNLAIVGGQIKEFALNINNVVGQREVPISQNLICDFIKWRSPFNHPTVMLNKKIVKKVGGYISFGNLEDYYLWTRIIANNYNVKNISDVLVYMRVDDGMYSRRGNIKNIKYFYKLRRYLRRKMLISTSEEFIGDVIMSINIILPVWIRKKIYTIFLHNDK
ncbi:glycosyltransferase [Limosilactobacillus reuteri]|uniref:glycosyltransferase n=1 Tax=Limosilactobacillus reuteri TaxID=1598 RepID=UPI001E3FB34C|nr:glycosyltransferase [Limosilactobacillus reuteri]MCC4323955.1 glycosyltransferase [Limosilactobacillus reuteri]MCC4334310.1 glycosyltransferase [Limosilactobacillus reuteri]